MEGKMPDLLAALLDMRSGAVIADINRDFADIVGAVAETGKKGSITVTIEVAPSRVNKDRVSEVELTHKVALRKPKPNFGRSIFFVTESNELTRTDPNQTLMEFEDEKSRKAN
jgi:hypothetical protein